MTDFQQLCGRFLEDSDSLSEDEVAALIAALEQAPSLAEQLRTQLTIDELLRQRRPSERGDFLAQVRQRIDDYQHGEEELERRTVELRQLAMRQLGAPSHRTRGVSAALVLATSAALLLAVAAGLYWLADGNSPSARLANVAGIVSLVRDGRTLSAERLGELAPGDTLVSGPVGSAEIVFDDGTTVRLAADTVLSLQKSGGKHIQLSQGELLADVSRQARGQPMIFRTSTAEATVLGTRLRLQAAPLATALEVMEGAVEMRSLAADGAESRVITEGQIAYASQGGVVAHSAAWPLERQGLLFLWPEAGGEGLVRFAESGAMAPLERLSRRGRRTGGALAAPLKKSAALSLEVIYRAADADSDISAPEPLVQFLDERERAVCELSQSGGWLWWRSPTPVGVREYQLAPALPGVTSHLAITADADGWQAFQNGQRVFQSADRLSPPALWPVETIELAIHPGAEKGRRAALLGVAVYDRALSADLALASSRRMPLEPSPAEGSSNTPAMSGAP